MCFKSSLTAVEAAGSSNTFLQHLENKSNIVSYITSFTIVTCSYSTVFFQTFHFWHWSHPHGGFYPLPFDGRISKIERKMGLGVIRDIQRVQAGLQRFLLTALVFAVDLVENPLSEVKQWPRLRSCGSWCCHRRPTDTVEGIHLWIWYQLVEEKWVRKQTLYNISRWNSLNSQSGGTATPTWPPHCTIKVFYFVLVDSTNYKRGHSKSLYLIVWCHIKTAAQLWF